MPVAKNDAKPVVNAEAITCFADLVFSLKVEESAVEVTFALAVQAVSQSLIINVSALFSVTVLLVTAAAVVVVD